MGQCDVLTNDGRNLSSPELLSAPVQPASRLYALYGQRYAAMAEQCAVARMPTPPLCCGEPARACGAHVCDHSWAATNARFAYAKPRRRAVAQLKTPAS